MASIATVVTIGYGSFGSVNLLPTIGYGIGAASTPVFGCGTALSAYSPQGSALSSFAPAGDALTAYSPGATAQSEACSC